MPRMQPGSARQVSCDVLAALAIRIACLVLALAPTAAPALESLICGDLDRDGVVAASDLAAYRRILLDPGDPSLPPGSEDLCSVIGMPGPCDLRDVVVVARALQGMAPGIDDRCPAASQLCEGGPVQCADLDTDGIPDVLDPDDDGDGWRDELDPEPQLAARQPGALDPDRVLLGRVSADLGASGRAPGVARIGTPLRIEGQGFSADPAQSVVVFAGEDGPINALPFAAGPDFLDVLVPAGARTPLHVISDARRSGVLDLTVLPPGAPVILAPRSSVALPGSSITLRGLDLIGVDRVRFGSLAVPPTRSTATSIEVVVPVGAPGGDLMVTSAGIPSNVVSLAPGATVEVEVLLPQGLALDPAQLRVSAGLSAEMPLDPATDRAPVVVARDAAQLVDVALTGSTAPLLAALAVPGEPTLVVDELSTASAWILQMTDLPTRGSPAELAAARDVLESLPEVAGLAGAIAAGLAQSTDFLASPPPSFWQQFTSAALAADAVLLPPGGGAPGSLQPAVLEDGSRPAPGEAVIEPASEQFDVLVAQIEGTGDVRVENDSMLFLSVRMTDLQGGTPLRPHIDGYFDPGIIGTQSGLLTGFHAADVALGGPRYRSAGIQVVTPGFAAPQPTDPDALDALFWLRSRTFIDRTILPIAVTAIQQVLGNSGGDRLARKLSLALISGIIQSAPIDTLVQVRADYAAGRPIDGLGLLVGVLKADLENIGPITSALAGEALGSFEDALVQSVVTRIARKMLPGVGGVDALLAAASAAVTAINVGKTVADFVSTPGQIDFEVFFDTVLLDARDRVLERREIPDLLALEGYGLHALPDGTLPEIILTDRGEGIFETERLTPEFISSDGRRLHVALSGVYLANVFGPVHVELRRGDDHAVLPFDLEVVGEPEIDFIAPGGGDPGDLVELTGSGFSTSGDLRVRLLESAVTRNDPVSLFATVMSVSEDRVTFVVPEQAGDLPAWRVYVHQGSVGYPRRSNSVLFRTGECFRDLGGLPGGIPDAQGMLASAAAISDTGMVVGAAATSDGIRRPFVWTAQDGMLEACAGFAGLQGAFTDVSPGGVATGTIVIQPGTRGNNVARPVVWDQGVCTSPLGQGPFYTQVEINDLGQMVGGAGVRPVLWDGGLEIDLGTLRDDDSGTGIAHDINDAGQIVGRASAASPGERAFLWQDGSMIDLQGGWAMAINNRGEVVLQDAGATLWAAGARTPLGRMRIGSTFRSTQGWALNDLGQVVGYGIQSFPRVDRAFVWLPGPAMGLPEPGLYDLNDFVDDWRYTLRRAVDINELGQIVGTAGFGSETRAFLLDPALCRPSRLPQPHVE